jgi:hypothetical protein
VRAAYLFANATLFDSPVRATRPPPGLAVVVTDATALAFR